MTLLEVRGITRSFSGLRALDRVSLTVQEGSAVAVIGPNGAGKTTLFGVVAGGLPADEGSVHFGGRDVTGWPAHRVARAGLVRTFQLMRPFDSMTVLDNVAAAAHATRRRRADARAAAAEVVERVGLSGYRDQPAAGLPTAALKRLELARALALRPRLLLLDEVLAGLVPAERAPMLELLNALRAEGVTLLFVEHVMAAVMSLADRVVVLHHGQVLATGTPAEVTADPRVQDAYLGEDFGLADHAQGAEGHGERAETAAGSGLTSECGPQGRASEEGRPDAEKASAQGADGHGERVETAAGVDGGAGEGGGQSDSACASEAPGGRAAARTAARPSAAASALLIVESLRAGYRRLPVLHDVSLSVAEGEIVSLIGANGAGKTTTLRAISGMLRPTGGSVRFDGRPADRLAPHDLVRAGLVHVPQGRALFGPMTVRENLELGGYVRGERRPPLDEVFALFPVLEQRLDQRADTMSGGQQQMLAIGRALLARPRLLLLDEPSLGLAPNLVSAVFDAVTRIRDRGVTVLLVEQNAARSLRIADRAYVIENGRVVLDGPGPDLLSDARVRSAYLGT